MIDYGQEDFVFGSSSADARHWDRYVLDVFEANKSTLADLFSSSNILEFHLDNNPQAKLTMGTTTGTNVDGAFPPWNFNVCTILTSSSPMSSAIKRGNHEYRTAKAQAGVAQINKVIFVKNDYVDLLFGFDQLLISTLFTIPNAMLF